MFETDLKMALDAQRQNVLRQEARAYLTRPMATYDADYLGDLVAEGLNLTGEASTVPALAVIVRGGSEAALRALWPALDSDQIAAALLAALDAGHPAMTRHCLVAGALANFETPTAHRPLLAAATHNRLDLVELLQAAGAAPVPPAEMVTLLGRVDAATFARLVTPATLGPFDIAGVRTTLAEAARDLHRPDLGAVLRAAGAADPPPSPGPLPLMPAFPSSPAPAPSGWRRTLDRLWPAPPPPARTAAQLTAALRRDDASAVRALQAAGLSLAASLGYASPLRQAVHHNASGSAAVLLDAGAPLHETQGSEGPFPHALSLALLTGPSRVLDLLWARSDPHDRHRVLEHALRRGHAPAVAWALEHGAAAHWPQDQPDVLDQVVARINAQTPGLALPTPTEMRTPFLLDIALLANRPDLIALLRAHAAPAGPQTEPLAGTAAPSTVRALLAHYPEVATRHSRTAVVTTGPQPLLFHVAANGRFDLVDLVLDAGADPSAPGMALVQEIPAARAWLDGYPARRAARAAHALETELGPSHSRPRARL